MTAVKTQKRAEDLDVRAKALAERMEEVAVRYLEAIGPWAAGRFEADVSAAVVGAPGVTGDLGADGMARLRAGLEALVATTPDLVRRRVGTRGAWPHRWDRAAAAIPEGLYGAKGTGGRREVVVPPFLQQRLRVLLGASGHLLARHGYQAYVRRHWDRAYARSDYFPPEYLARGLDGHEEFQTLLAEYGDLCDEYAGVIEGLRAGEQERSARAAGDLWKQA